MSIRHIPVLDVGAPSSGFQSKDWEKAEVRFHDFASLPCGRGDETMSQQFSCLGHQWQLGVFPGGHTASTAIDDKVLIILYSMSEKSVDIEFGFSIKESRDLDDEIAKRTWNELVVRDRGSAIMNDQDHNCYFQVQRSTILNLLVSGTLVIDVRMRLTDSNDRMNTHMTPFIPQNPFCNMMLKYFMDEETADVVFEVEYEEKKIAKFHAHRFILKMCAPMLNALCGSEAGVTAVPILDAKSEIFHLLLYYVYGGKVGDKDLKSHAQDIINVADKFGVPNLKLEAEACYVKSVTINVENVMENLLYADSKNCALLKEVVMDFMVKNWQEVLDKVSLKDAPGGLLGDALRAMARNGVKAKGKQETGDDLSLATIHDLRRKAHEKGLDIDGSRETLIDSLKKLG